MAKNRVIPDARHLSITATHPTAPASGQPCRMGDLTGVALIDEKADGTVVADVGNTVWKLPVKGVNDSGNTAIAAGDGLYYVDADIGSGSGFLSKKISGRFFGIALATVNSGSTTTIEVLHLAPAIDTSPGAELDGNNVAVAGNANVDGAIPVLHRVDIVAGALANTDVVLTDKTRVIDAWLVLRGAGVSSTTLQVKNGTNAITNAMAASGSDQAIVHATSLDDANWEIAAGGTLRVTSATGASQPDATVYVLGVKVA
jgi:predicted RecA/RadA family phage recombinase